MKTHTRTTATAFIAAALLLPLGPAPAQKSPEKIRLTAAAKDGAVLIRVPLQPFGSALQFSKNGSSGFMSRVYLMKVEKGAVGTYGWIARTLAPGRYRLDSMWQQGHWSACLEQGTFEFEVKPGKIEYIGTLNLDAVLESLQQQAVSAGQVAQGGTAYFLSHGQTRVPPIGDRDEPGLAAARRFADTGMNRSGPLVELAALHDTAFGTSGVGKAIKVCG